MTIKLLKFQSTHPYGVRLARGNSIQLATDVSIHAPVWGATGGADRHHGRLPGFNPRTRMGCDKEVLIGTMDAFPVSIHAPVWGATVQWQ